MIDLYNALKITHMFDCENEVLRLCREGNIEPFTVKSVKERFDLRETKVVYIEPYFVCGEYDGILFDIR